MQNQDELQLEGEIWKVIPNYNGKYEISNCGRVKCVKIYEKDRFGHKEPFIMKQSKVSDYRSITLSLNGKKKYPSIHRLVAEAFLENPENKPWVNHIDSNPSNNHFSNLIYCTPVENNKHGWEFGNAKPTFGKAILNPITGETYKSISEAAKVIGITQSNLGGQLANRLGRINKSGLIYLQEPEINLEDYSIL